MFHMHVRGRLREWLLVLGILGISIPTLVTVWKSSRTVISGEHGWRQADTYSVARNFVEHPNFFYPRVSHTRGGTGISGMEMPIYAYSSYLMFHLFGIGAPTAKLTTLLFFFFGLLGFFLLLSHRAPWFHWAALLGAVICSPITLYYCRQVQPDIPMVSLGLFGIFLAFKSREKGLLWALLAALVFGLGILTKYPLLFAWPAFVVALASRKHSKWALFGRVVISLVPLVLLVAWLLWCKKLEATYGVGKPYFAATPGLAALLKNLKTLQLGHAVGHLFPHYVVAYPFYPVVIYGFVVSFRKPYRDLSAPFWAWLAGAICLAILFSWRYKSHYYYAVLDAPPIWYFGTLGLSRLLFGEYDRESGQFVADDEGSLKYECGMALLLWAIIAFSFGLKYQSRAALPHAVWIFAAACLLLAPLVHLFAPFAWRSLRGFVLMMLFGAVFWYSTTSSLASFHSRFRRYPAHVLEKRIKKMRALMSKHVGKKETIVCVMGSSNPWYLYAAERKGWAMPKSKFHRRGVTYFAKKGARWIVVSKRDTGYIPYRIRRLKRVATRGEWMLYSLKATKKGRK